MKKGDKVLVSSPRYSGYWQPRFYEENNICSHIPNACGIRYQEVIPYEGNEHLLFTNDPAPAKPKPGEWWLVKAYIGPGHKRSQCLYAGVNGWQLEDGYQPMPYCEYANAIPIRKIA